MLKKLFLLSTLIVLIAPTFSSATQKPYIISGFDDVLRQAENTGLVKSAIKMFEQDKTFSGMPELYTGVSATENNTKFTLVSATSIWFTNRVDEFLTDAHFPARRLYLRDWVTEWSIEDFKISHIQDIIKEKPNRQFIVIFDNSDPSLVMAETIHTNFPDKVLEVYLRQTIQKTLPASAHPFFTAFDIALNEYRNERLSLPELKTVAAAVIKENQTENLFPSYALCPKDYDPCQSAEGEASSVCAQVKDHVQALCKTRY